MANKPIRLGFTDTNQQITDFFTRILGVKYDITIDNENPEYLIFGDRNFGQHNLTYDPNKVTKIFYTGENQRPWDYQAHYALTFDHVENERHYRLPFYVIYNSHNQTLINNILDFFKIFQKQPGYVDLIEQAIKAYSELTVRKEFYFFYNDLYWYLPLKQPYVHITYNKVPLPGTA
jgi:hypothetical protein